jgi:hypothetical protein
MNLRWPSSCLRAGSSIYLKSANHGSTFTLHHIKVVRRYAQHSQPVTSPRPDVATNRAVSHEYASNSALKQIEAGTKGDPVNPPRSTLPPPLVVPERGPSTSFFAYWYSVGKAYTSFYKSGIAAVWYNRKAADALKARIKRDHNVQDMGHAAAEGLMSRSDWQILQRNSHDIGKLPVFGLMVLIFGEWTPLLVAFVPNTVPGTCYIPQQVRGMREKAEERRRITFRAGNFEPPKEQVNFTKSASWPTTNAAYIQRQLLKPLRADQLHHLSSTLSLHSRMWDRVQLYPLRFLVQRRLAQHLRYLALDDNLLLRDSRESSLSLPELERACEERGMDILGRPEAVLRGNLSWWLRRQQNDEGRGRAMLSMLFRRLDIARWVKLHLDANRDSQT